MYKQVHRIESTLQVGADHQDLVGGKMFWPRASAGRSHRIDIWRVGSGEIQRSLTETNTAAKQHYLFQIHSTKTIQRIDINPLSFYKNCLFCHTKG